ncbi:MAG: hypothetical protein ABJD68_08890, partial [Nakamurella sp.]
IRQQPSTFSGCHVHQRTVPAKVTNMYEVRVTAHVATVGPIQCADLDAAADVLQQRLISSIKPGRRVMWVVRCPSGRLVRGDITINAASTDRMEAVREHVTEIRDILANDGRSKESPTRDNEE